MACKSAGNTSSRLQLLNLLYSSQNRSPHAFRPDVFGNSKTIAFLWLFFPHKSFFFFFYHSDQ